MQRRRVDILLVEDNPDDSELALRAFRKAGLTNRVFVVRDGAEALDFVFATGKFSDRNVKDSPTLVLLDLFLPRVHGLDVLRTIKADIRTRNIPVIIVAGSCEERDIMRSYRTGAEHYLIKPFQFQEFLSAVSHLGLDWHPENATGVLVEA